MSSSVDRLTQIFITSLGIAGSTDVPSLEYRGIPEWDSVAHMQLVSDIEGEFDIMLDTEDIIAMSSFAKTREILAKYGVDV
jgi:acyl carrier protein